MIKVEDGTGVAGANSYVSVEDALLYNAIRQNEEWDDAADADQKARLVHATDYIDAHFVANGSPATIGQALQWPITGTSTVPGAVVRATCELALYALSGPLSGPSERGIKSTKKTLEGVGTTETVYDEESSDPFPHITAMLSGVARPRSSGEPFVLTMGRLS